MFKLADRTTDQKGGGVPRWLSSPMPESVRMRGGGNAYDAHGKALNTGPVALQAVPKLVEAPPTQQARQTVSMLESVPLTTDVPQIGDTTTAPPQSTAITTMPAVDPTLQVMAPVQEAVSALHAINWRALAIGLLVLWALNRTFRGSRDAT